MSDSSDILADASDRLGRHVAGLVNIVDPELVVISGKGMRFSEPLFALVRAPLAAASYPEPPKLVIDESEAAWERGAAFTIDHVFDFEAMRGHTGVEPRLCEFDEVAA